MRLSFFRGVPCRLPGVLCYSLSLSYKELCCFSIVTFSLTEVFRVSPARWWNCQRTTVIQNIFETVRFLAWFPLQHLPWTLVHQLQLLALHGLFQPFLCCWRGLWLSGWVRGRDQRWCGWILAFDGTEFHWQEHQWVVSDLRRRSWW